MKPIIFKNVAVSDICFDMRQVSEGQIHILMYDSNTDEQIASATGDSLHDVLLKLAATCFTKKRN